MPSALNEWAAPMPRPLEVDAILAEARRRTGLEDLGDTWFLEPMQRFVDAANSEARLTEAGVAGQFETAVNNIANRLRMIEDLRRNPEILDEEVEVAGVILGLPRTGSTIFQKLVSSAPGMTTVRWFEGSNYAMFPDEERGNAVERRAFAQAVIDGWLSISPEIASQHPMFPDAPAEEIMILGQLFISTLMEGMAHVPGFAAWLDGYDQSQGHADLKTILQYLQWQNPDHRGRKWVLKSPSHLPYAEAAARAFPDAALIMTHRDPVEAVPSCISMMTSLYRLSSRVDDRETCAFWFPRLVTWLGRFQAARERIGEDRFIDVSYADFMRDPVAQAMPVLERMNLRPDAGMERMLTDFMEANRRDRRPAHAYSLSRFGLEREDVERAFASYRERYIR